MRPPLYRRALANDLDIWIREGLVDADKKDDKGADDEPQDGDEDKEDDGDRHDDEEDKDEEDKDEKNKDDVLKILSARVGLEPDEYEPLLGGTYLLSLDEVGKVWEMADGLESVFGSSRFVDDFNVKYEVYKAAEFKNSYFDASLTKALMPQAK